MTALSSYYDQGRAFIEQLEDQLFEDGYCVCRCGPEHHRLTTEMSNPVRAEIEISMTCGYHRQCCGTVTVAQELFEPTAWKGFTRKMGSRFREGS